MFRFALHVLAALFVFCLIGLSAQAQQGRPGHAPEARSMVEPVRLCGTNSSRSRRCNFGYRDCLRDGREDALCLKALSICRACITKMVACSRNTAASCTECHEQYGACMEPWVKLQE
jgi:hypothetical protein